MVAHQAVDRSRRVADGVAEGVEDPPDDHLVAGGGNGVRRERVDVPVVQRVAAHRRIPGGVVTGCEVGQVPGCKLVLRAPLAVCAEDAREPQLPLVRQQRNDRSAGTRADGVPIRAVPHGEVGGRPVDGGERELPAGGVEESAVPKS